MKGGGEGSIRGRGFMYQVLPPSAACTKGYCPYCFIACFLVPIRFGYVVVKDSMTLQLGLWEE